jgi:hypothetical protein
MNVIELKMCANYPVNIIFAYPVLKYKQSKPQVEHLKVILLALCAKCLFLEDI